jgi:tripartite-type tricarboxylate transporter receptor subunit TctC
MSPTLYQSMPYDPTTAFAPITPVAVFPDVVARLHKALADAVADPALKQIFGALGAETELISPEQFGLRIRTDFDRWSAVIKQAGIAMQ